MTTTTATFTDRYARQTIYPNIGPEGQAKLAAARVCVMGVGALGTHIADTLARAGVGFLRIVDRDVPVASNLQRQTLFVESDVIEEIPKAIAAERRLTEANSEITIDARVMDVNSTNIESLVRDVDLVLDGSDNFEIRYLINDACVKLGKPWVYGGVIGSYGMTMTIRPQLTSCLRCVFGEPPAPGEAPTCDTAGVIGPAVSMVAAFEAAEAIKLIVGAVDALNSDLLAVDVWQLSFDRIPLTGAREDCPACGQGNYEFLDRSAPSQTTELCGRDAIQVQVHPPAELSLAQLAERLKMSGTVGFNQFLLRFQAERYDITVFPDGRAIIKGTVDPAEARSVYARYIGM